MAAQAAVAAVRKGCEMLNEGKAEISKLKKTVEQLGREISCEIPPNKSKGYLITVEDLLTGTRKWKNEKA